MFLDYEVDNIELIARRLSKGDNLEFKRLLNDEPISEIIYLYAIDSATIHAENKNAES